MLKIFKFFKSASGEAKMLTMRQRFEAAQEELNAVLADLSEMPKLSLDANERKIELIAPEQFPDEALALPAPQKVAEPIAKDVADQDEPSSDSASEEIEKAVA